MFQICCACSALFGSVRANIAQRDRAGGGPRVVNEREIAPYAPARTLLRVIERHREATLPDPLVTTTLEQLGVPASMAPRTHQALRFLGLVDEGGHRTEAFERLQRATSDEYPDRLAEIVRAAYQPVFAVLNPSEHNDIALADAFRRYEPSGQRGKMITLFRSLCEAGAIVEPSASRSPRAGSPTSATSGATRARRSHETPARLRAEAGANGRTGGHDLVLALIHQLPGDREWTEARRKRWLNALEAVVDLSIEIRAPSSEDSGDGRHPSSEGSDRGSTL